MVLASGDHAVGSDTLQEKDPAAPTKWLPTIVTLVSSIDEADGNEVQVTEARDDSSALSVVDTFCAARTMCGFGQEEACTDLILEEDELQGGPLADSSPVKVAPSKHISTMSDKQTNPKSATNTGADTSDEGAFMDNLCHSPRSVLETGTIRRNEIESQNSGKDDADEDKSLTSMSAFGKMFEDLTSLPSLSPFGRDSSAVGNEKDDADITSAGSLGEFSVISEKRNAMYTLASGSSLDENKSFDLVNSEQADMNLDDLKLEPYEKLETVPLTRMGQSGVSQVSVAESAQSQCKILEEELRLAREIYGVNHVKCANIISSMAEASYTDKDYDEALRLFAQANSIYSTKLGDTHITTVNSKVRTAATLEMLGRHDAAIEVYGKVLEIRRCIYGDSHSSVADTLTLISRALRKKERRVPQALKELKRALKLYRSNLGDSHPKVSSCVDDIAELYMLNDNPSKAALILEEVVKLKAATRGMNNKDVASSLMRLGIAQHAAGDTLTAFKSLKKAYAIYVSVGGEDCEEALSVLYQIARYAKGSGDHKKAVSAYMAVLKGQKKTLSSHDVRLAETYVDLGLCLRENGAYDKAAKCFKQALAICVADDNHIQDVETVASVMHELGIAHQLRGLAKDAVNVFKQELAIRRKLKNNTEKIARTLFFLGTGKYDLGDYPAALAFLTEALAIYETAGNDLGLDFAETLFSTGLVFQATLHLDRSRDAFLESLKLFYAHGLGGDHELVKMGVSKLQELGHSCQCEESTCIEVPCKSIYGTVKC